jgi:hypothetical protein
MLPFLTKLASSLRNLGMKPEKVTNRVSIYGDYGPFMIQGVPTMMPRSTLENEMGRYYHTAGDTYDKLDFKSLNECAAVVAVTLMELADAGERISERKLPDQVEAMFIEHDLKNTLEMQGLWPFHGSNE